MIAIVDYDMGNLKSVQKAFEAVGHRAAVTRDPKAIATLLLCIGVFLDVTLTPGFPAFAADAGNITSIKDAAGNVTRFEYEPTFNRATTITDALNQATRFTYDANGNLLTIANPLNQTTTLAYNAFGQPTSVTDPLNNTTTFDYDPVGDLAMTTDPLGNRTQRVSDAVSRLVSLVDPRGFSTQFRYDDLNRITEIADARQKITRFAYDPNGNLLSVTDAKGQTTTYTYDSMDRLATRTDSLGRTEIYEYDKNGNLVRFTDRKGQVSTFTYDAQNRRIGATYANGRTRTYVYDTVGRLVSVMDSFSGRIDFIYDVLDRPTHVATPQGVIEYTYDAIGRRTSMTVAGQQPVTYTYDAASRLIQVAQGTQVITIGYDAAGRRTSLTYPNGITTSYTYDAASRVTSLRHQGPSGLIESVSYTYDAAGNRLSVNQANGPAALPPAAMTAAVYDAANQQIQFNAATLTYDANGNLTSDGINTYTWDALNQLEAISGPNLFASFTYDALGRRVSKTIGGVTTQFLYDGQDIAAEIQGGAVGATYIRSLSIDELFVRITGSGNEYYHTDALGSTLALTNSAGAVTTTYAYEPFGRTQITGTSNNPFQYTGRENDGTGLYYYRARYYSPMIGRFLSEDPFNLASIQLPRHTVSLNSVSVPFEVLTRNVTFARPDPFTITTLRLPIPIPGTVQVRLPRNLLLMRPAYQHPYLYTTNNPLAWRDPWGTINWGNAFGQAFGGVVGNVLGYTADAVGMVFDTGGNGAYYGGAIGGAALAVTGGVLSGGNPVAAIGGGLLGGFIGSQIGEFFDDPCAGQLNCGEQVPPPKK